jgi:large subunit ribosomal protein L21
MYAIIRTGGKQYKVQAGDTLRVEKLERELGSEFDLSEVLVVGGEKTYVGEPIVKGAFVTVVVTRQEKAPKVIVFKKKRRQGYRRMRGHRQLYTELFVKSITTPEGQTDGVVGEKSAQVHDPAKKAAQLAKAQELRQARKESGPKGKQAKAATKKVDLASSAAVTKKKVRKKAAGKAKKVVKKGKVTKKAATKVGAKKKQVKKKS